jgi:hypothetical protein
MAMLAASCHDGLGNPNSFGDNMIRLDYSFQASETKADIIFQTEEEKHLDEIGVIFYDIDGKKQLAAATLQPPSQDNISFPAPDALNDNTTYKVLVIVNGSSSFTGSSSSMADYISVNHGRSYQGMKDFIELTNTKRLKPSLPFWGESSYLHKSDGSASIGITLTRAVAKIRLHNTTNRFRIAWAKVSNYRTGGYLFHATGHTGNIAAGATSPAIGNDEVTRPIEGTEQINSGLYCFPNMVSASTQADNKTTCLVIAGYYNPAGWGVGETTTDPPTFYRVNISRGEGDVQILKPNKLYTIKIDQVNGKGDETEEGALDNKNSSINVTINDWVEDNDGSEIETDKEGNFLQATPSYITFSHAKDEVKYIDINIKEGTTWNYALSSNIYFSAVKDPLDPYRLVVKTLSNGEMAKAHTASINITVSRGNQLLNLSKKINLTQLSEDGTVEVLIVNDKSSDFTEKASPTGNTFKFPVITGSPRKGWVAEVEGGTNNWCSPGLSGGNGQVMEIHTKANVTDQPRQCIVAVHYDRNNNGIADIKEATDAGASTDGIPSSIKITITQEVSTVSISVFPAYDHTNPLVMNGFQTRHHEENAVVDHRDITVITSYPKYRVSINKTIHTLRFTKSTDIDFPTVSTTDFLSHESFRIMLMHLGPGDIYPSTTITITPMNEANEIIASAEPYVFTIEIVNTCVFAYASNPTTTEGHVYLDIHETNEKLYIYDRNTGAPGIDNMFADGLNYSNQTSHPDNKDNLEQGKFHTKFKGYFVLHKEVIDGIANEGELIIRVCPEGWTVPTVAEGQLIIKRMRLSMDRVYIVGDGTDAFGKYVGAYFPTGGYAGDPNENVARYRLAYLSGREQIMFYRRRSGGEHMSFVSGHRFLVRCVRRVANP